MVSHLHTKAMSDMHKSAENIKLQGTYQGRPVVTWANLKTDCMYLLKNHTSSRAPAHPSSSAPRTASKTALGSNAEAEVAASMELVKSPLSPLLLKDLAWGKLSIEVNCCWGSAKLAGLDKPEMLLISETDVKSMLEAADENNRAAALIGQAAVCNSTQLRIPAGLCSEFVRYRKRCILRPAGFQFVRSLRRLMTCCACRSESYGSAIVGFGHMTLTTLGLRVL